MHGRDMHLLFSTFTHAFIIFNKYFHVLRAISGFEEIEVSKHIPLPLHISLPSRI